MKRIPTRELQIMKLNVLKNVDQICKKNDIQYFLAYGTLLGAVREKGFIPWDEDIDLWMTRDNYKRFCEVAQKDLNETYYLQTFATDKYYFTGIARICINNTYRGNGIFDKYEFHKGTFIDIFPLDKAPTDDDTCNKHYKKCRRLYRAMEFCLSNSRSGKIWKLPIKRTLQFMLRAIPIDVYKRRLEEELQRYNVDEAPNYIDCNAGYQIERVIYPKKLFQNTVYMKFEDGEFPCPAGYDELLTHIYGDYMTPPPPSEYKIDQPSYYI